jgi:hypothetical protein
MPIWLYAAIARRDAILVHTITANDIYDMIASDIRFRLDPNIRLISIVRDIHRYFFLNDECGLNFVIVGYLATRPAHAHVLLERLRTQFLSDPATAGWADAEAMGLQDIWAGMLHRILNCGAGRPVRDGMEEVLIGGDDATLDGVSEEEETGDGHAVPFARVCCFISWGLVVAVAVLIAALILFLTV